MNLAEHFKEWYKPLYPLLSSNYIKNLAYTLKLERKKHTIYPSSENMFRVFRLCPPHNVKIVILGQDPYIRDNQAHGLAFSVKPEICSTTPPSLVNIFKELETDIGHSTYHNPNLTRWAKQGVLLLNTALTVREGASNSHKDLWKPFTKYVIQYLAQEKRLFLLWGKHAQQYSSLIQSPSHYYCSAHPSPFSAYRGFYGSKPFSKANKWLENNKLKPIKWLDNE